MIHLLLLKFKDGRSQNHPLAPLLDSGPQKKRAQVLLNGARADAQFGCDFFITAALDKQPENLLVAASNFDLIEVQHVLFVSS
jgi:hypothetical protein